VASNVPRLCKVERERRESSLDTKGDSNHARTPRFARGGIHQFTAFTTYSSLSAYHRRRFLSSSSCTSPFCPFVSSTFRFFPLPQLSPQSTSTIARLHSSSFPSTNLATSRRLTQFCHLPPLPRFDCQSAYIPFLFPPICRDGSSSFFVFSSQYILEWQLRARHSSHAIHLSLRTNHRRRRIVSLSFASSLPQLLHIKVLSPSSK